MGAPQQLRIVIADDHPLYIDGMVQAIDAQKDMRVVAQCHNGNDALARITTLTPDVAVLDLRMGGVPVLQIIEHVARRQMSTRIMVLSGFAEPAVVSELLESGAYAYLTKETPRDAICSTIRRVAAGETTIGLEAHHGLVSQMRERRDRENSILAERELQCLELLAEGLTTQQMAARLIVEQSTVKTHLHHLYGKLGVNNAAAAVAEGLRRKLIR